MIQKRDLDGLALLHDLVPFLPIDRLHAILNNQPLPTEAHGAAMFADISGFTALAEQLALELGPERGAEELNQRINRAFASLIDIVDRYKGSVIRFSGDGLTSWFAGEAATLRAATAGLGMQAVMKALTTTFPGLRLKIGVGSGMTRRFRLGDPELGVYDVLAGPAVEQMMGAEGRAEPGQVVLSPEAFAELEGQIEGVELEGGFWRLEVTVFATRLGERWPSIRWLDHLEQAWTLVEACRPYLLPPIYERLSAGHGAYMADLRTVSPLFIRFTGIDYTDPAAEDQFDALVRAAQRIVTQHGGYLNEVGVGDKGSVLVALFGAPVAPESPSVQASYCALALQEQLPYAETLQCGLTSGELFAGTVGSAMRRAYAVIGSGVILAARLMSGAEPGEILADAQTPQPSGDLAWEALPPMRVKGRVAPVRVYRLTGLAESTRPLRPIGQFMGRIHEVRALAWTLEALEFGEVRALILKGEAGLGKSHLLREFAAMVRERGIVGMFGSGRSVERQIPYRAWRDIFTRYFELDRRADPQARQNYVVARVAQTVPDLANHAPLLNDVLQVGIPENDLTSALDPSQRKAMLISLLVALLRAWLQEDTLAIALDDAQWLDPPSWELLLEVAVCLKDYPLILLITMRPFQTERETPRPLLALEELPYVRQFLLAPLSMADALALAAEHLGVEALPDSIINLIVDRTGGNPFFIQEIVSVLRNSGIVRVEDGEAVLEGDPATLQLPDTVQGLIRSRIDRLPPDQQLLLKVAAVIGQQFPYRALHDVQPLELDDEALRDNLDELTAFGLRRAETLDGETAYVFHSVITREIAYGALPFSQRRRLHRAVAQWYEQEYRDNLIPYALLAHHWRMAEDGERERLYCTLAGMRAAEQYASEDAIIHLERALELTPPEDQAALYPLLKRLENAYRLSGSRIKQHLALIGLERLAQESGDGSRCAEVHALYARYDDSIAAYSDSLSAARSGFEAAAKANDIHLMNLNSVYQGLALLRLGRYDEARQFLQTTSDDPVAEALRLNTLGDILLALGDDETAYVTCERALNQSRNAGDQAGTAQALGNLGRSYMRLNHYEQAFHFQEEGIKLWQIVGDRQGTARASANLAELALRMGDFYAALSSFERAYQLSTRVGDRSGAANALGGIGMTAFLRGDAALARSFLAHSLEIRRRIGKQPNLGAALSELALAEIATNRLKQAEGLLIEALTVDSGTGGTRQRAATLAIYGLLELRLDNRSGALDSVETALALLTSHGGLKWLEYPFPAALCYFQVLAACDQQARAAAVLKEAYDLLLAVAGRFSDSERRERFLTAVLPHRQIVALSEQAGRPPLEPETAGFGA